MSFVRKNGFFSDTMKKAKDVANKGMNKGMKNVKNAANKGMKNVNNAANKGMKKAKELKNKFDDELKTLSIDDALNTFNISEKDAKQDLMENGKQFVPPNKL
jgi:hypothetical protein